MATRNFTVSQDARVGNGEGLNLGAGACAHLPVGSGGSPEYTYRSFLKFDHDWSDMTSISLAKLYIRLTDTYHLSRTTGSIYIDRVTQNWGAGTASHPMTTTNGWIGSSGSGNYMVYPGPSCSTTVSGNDVSRITSGSISGSDNEWVSIDITSLLRQWAPSSVMVGGAAGYGRTNYGIRLLANTGEVEIWSEDKGASYAAYIKVTYSTNSAPDKPVITSPTSEQRVAGGTTYGTPSITVTATGLTDPDGDALTAYILVKNEAGTALAFDTYSATGITGSTFSRALSSASIPRGQRLQVILTTYDGVTATASDPVFFTINDASLPVIAGTDGQTMEMSIEGSETNPRFTARWSYSDPEGDAQYQYQAILYANDGTTVLEDSGVATSANPYHRFAYASLSRTTSYKVKVQVWDANGLGRGYTAQRTLKAQWALADYRKDLGLVPASWTASHVISAVGNQRVDVSYNSASDAADTNLGTWTTDLNAVTKRQWYRVRFWLFAWLGGTTPTVSSSSIQFIGTSLPLPDGWSGVNTPTVSVIEDDFKYGTRSIRVDAATGAEKGFVYATVPVRPNTTYTLSGWVRAFGGDANAAWRVRAQAGAGYNELALASASDAVSGWQWVKSTSFDSGSATQVEVGAWCLSGTTGSYAYFDSVKLEASTVATPWTPSNIGRTIVVDGSGVQIDGKTGGVLRLRGSTGGTRDLVELGANGLKFGGDLDVHSPLAGYLHVGALRLSEQAAPGTPPSGFAYMWVDTNGVLNLLNDSGANRWYIPNSLLTTQGDLPYASAANTWARLPKGTARQQLIMNSGATAPEWASLGGQGYLTSFLTADYDMSTQGNVRDVGPSVTLTYGVWDVWCRVLVMSSTTNTAFRTAVYLHDGTSYIDEAQVALPSMATGVVGVAPIYLRAIVDATGGNKTVTLKAQSDNTGHDVKANNQNYSLATNKATGIIATRIA